MKFIVALLLVAVAFCSITIEPLTYPVMGEMLAVGEKHNITWDTTHIPGDSVSIWINFNSTEAQDQFQNTNGNFNFTCVENDGFQNLDMTIPTEDIQKVVDEITKAFGLPDVDMTWVIDSLISTINAIPMDERNMTITVTPCNQNEAVYFKSYAYLSAAPKVFVALGAVLMAMLFVF
ncbi:hypothetical protein J8273_0756 [Carpediemonas membranifera]|uniref:Uncharacterized protein n=1 Tax=Carpediemonas membranifera TaxID=201153 RepID=A0A8J6C1I9_9EUKA|nr:hypothetical protein J8273_0756 [Carpediemonas membranifera]|eukprot:KAG9397626.1 hypothetical protein J8273_0756 [Carpediemonas membranifera]